MTLLTPFKVSGATFALSCMMLCTTPASAQQVDKSSLVAQLTQTSPGNFKNKNFRNPTKGGIMNLSSEGCYLAYDLVGRHIGRQDTDHRLVTIVENRGTGSCPIVNIVVGYFNPEVNFQSTRRFTLPKKRTRRLAPGEKQELVHIHRAPFNTKKLKYVASLEALNGQPWKAGYKKVEKVVFFHSVMQGQAQAGCDIALTYPPLGLTGNPELPGRQNHPYTVNVLVKNIGNTACPGALVRIYALVNSRRTWFGEKPFTSLNPGASQTLSFMGTTLYNGAKTYEAIATRRQDAFNDDLQSNHFNRRVLVRFAPPQ